MWDIIPGISQIKSLVQLAAGDEEGAERTALNFASGCPVVSQLTSGVLYLAGEEELAAENQKLFLKSTGELINNTLDGTPGVGQIKGGIHYAFGDKEGGEKALLSATRTTYVACSGIAGFVTGGPVAAYAAGVAGGVVTDELFAAVSGKKDKGPKDAGEIFDTTLGRVMDGFTGVSYGEMVGRHCAATLTDTKVLDNTVPPEAIDGLKKSVKKLNGKKMRQMTQEAKASNAQVKTVRQSGISNRQKRVQMKQIEASHPKRTQHNIHSLYRDDTHVGQASADVYPSSAGQPRGPHRVILEDGKRNYNLQATHYTDSHNYNGAPAARTQPFYRRPFNYAADHVEVTGTLAMASQAHRYHGDDDDWASVATL